MRMHNYMEEVVADELEILLRDKRETFCDCQKCKFDIMVWALNRLPPQYVITDRGRLFTKLSEQETQFKADVVKVLTKAIVHVCKNPNH
ncbi:MAG TPA: late competence development ComFB family protein [Candidatus Omnitrophota bacterium]|nr:late competence development ComFB family protein [Candidatus Omnitrophota bacterium]